VLLLAVTLSASAQQMRLTIERKADVIVGREACFHLVATPVGEPVKVTAIKVVVNFDPTILKFLAVEPADIGWGITAVGADGTKSHEDLVKEGVSLFMAVLFDRSNPHASFTPAEGGSVLLTYRFRVLREAKYSAVRISPSYGKDTGHWRTMVQSVILVGDRSEPIDVMIPLDAQALCARPMDGRVTPRDLIKARQADVPW